MSVTKELNRRSFLALLGSGVIGAGIDVDRLLWVPGAKTIFLPPARTAPTLVTVEWMAKEALRLLSRELQLGTRIVRDFRRVQSPTQTHVDFRLSPSDLSDSARFSDAFLRPAAHALACRIRHNGDSVFGEMELPPMSIAAARASNNLASVRVMQDDAYPREPLFRIDVLTGASNG